MAIWNQVPLSVVHQSGRTDAEYFKPSYLEALALLSGHKAQTLSSLAGITDGIHASPEVAEKGIRYISAKCVRPNNFIIDGCIEITNRQHECNPRTQLREGDVIITTVGTIGNVAVVEKSITPSNCDRHVGIIRVIDPKDLSPFYLSTFLNSKYGVFQSLRESAGNVQLNLYIKSIGKIVIPRLKQAESEIDEATKLAYSTRSQSLLFYSEAERLLESELGLGELISQHPIAYTASASDLESSRRLDAEYYNPGARSIVKKISSLAHTRVRDSFEVRSGFAWNSAKFLPGNSGEPVVRIRNIRPSHIVPNELTSIQPSYANSLGIKKAQKGDVVVGMDGIKYFYASLLEGECFVNQRVCHLSPRAASAASAEYTVFVINSVVGQAQLMRDMTVATTVGHITNRDVAKLVVPTISPTFHDHITELIRNSIACKEKSKRLLAWAKDRVEQIIEEALQS